MTSLSCLCQKQFRYPQTVSLIFPVSSIVTISDDPSSLASVLQAMHPGDAASRPQKLSLANIQPQPKVCVEVVMCTAVHSAAGGCRGCCTQCNELWVQPQPLSSQLGGQPHCLTLSKDIPNTQNTKILLHNNFACLYFNILILISRLSLSQYLFTPAVYFLRYSITKRTENSVA